MTSTALGKLSLLPSAFPTLGVYLVAAATANHHAGHGQGHLLHLLFSFGYIGLFLVSIVDSSFVPLPIPGITDVMLVLFAAAKGNVFLLVAIATAGSALGGYLSYQVGQHGGMAFLEKHIPKRIFDRVCAWMEGHAILAVALPAILPPPMPLSAFVLAAGALKMSLHKFMTAFTLSRLLRHAIAVWLGVRYGKLVLRIWNSFSEKWGTTILIVLWSGILLGCAFAFWKIYKTSKSVRSGGSSNSEPSPAAS